MRTIRVEPEQLESCAARMEMHEQDYERMARELTEAVEQMSSSWNGKDNLAFTSRIAEFDADYRQLGVLIAEYCEFLRQSARGYRQTQDELTAQAEAL